MLLDLWDSGVAIVLICLPNKVPNTSLTKTILLGSSTKELQMTSSLPVAVT
ncbi:conserved hypothetical protein [Ricinus communis]|uniref:Uncharacterized protein n=1 Tax=Ricinus communis TaxID=3988 RepID=B9T7C3_RICCO|nr:conserved hypothetical protein [Ricinus communis]